MWMVYFLLFGSAIKYSSTSMGNFTINITDNHPQEKWQFYKIARDSPISNIEKGKCVTIMCEMQTVLREIQNGEDTMNMARLGLHAIAKRTQEKVVLMLGTSRSGKTILSHYVCNKENNLYPHRADSYSSLYLIDSELENTTQVSRVYSYTIFPGLYTDGDVAFYDCPSFTGSKNVYTALISAYFLKKVANLVGFVKVVITVSYASISQGNSKRDLLTLFVHLTQFIKNWIKLRESVIVVITKIDNRFDDQADFVLEEVAIRLRDFQLWMMEEFEDDYPFDHSIAFENAFYLLERLISAKINQVDSIVGGTTVDKEELFKIGIFRRPYHEMPLRKQDLLQEEKPVLLERVHESMDYNYLNNDDFNYTFSEEYIFQISNILVELTKLIESRTHDVPKIFKDHINKENNSPDVGKTAEFYKKAYTTLREAMLEAAKSSNVGKMSEILANTSRELGLGIPEEDFLGQKVNVDFMQFLLKVTRIKWNTDTSQWLLPLLDDILKETEENDDWYTFLDSLNKTLNDPNFPNVTNKYSIPDAECYENFTDPGSNLGFLDMEVGIDDWKEYVKYLEQFNLKRYDDVKLICPTAEQIKELNKILRTARHKNNNKKQKSVDISEGEHKGVIIL